MKSKYNIKSKYNLWRHKVEHILVGALLLNCLVSFGIGDGTRQEPKTLGLASADTEEARPLKALLIAGGCCHDYANQHRIISEGIQARANVRVDVVWTRDTTHDPLMPLFKDPNWAEGYDFIIHDECAALKKDEAELANILAAHKTVPAVHLHCAMHSFRGSENDWAKHVGIKSTRHGPHLPVSLKIDRTHPITAPFEDWVTGKEELYNNVEVYGAEALITGTQTYKKAGKEVVDTAIVMWTNTKFGAPSFSTSLGHFNHNVEDPRYLDLVTRGALWASGRLNAPGYLGQPYTGSNLIHEIKDYAAAKKAKAEAAAPPANAVWVKATAQSSQTGEKHYPWHAVDGDPKTRWCGAGPQMPCWIQVEMEQPTTVSGAEIVWEVGNSWMQYTIDTSTDGVAWTRAFDASANEKAGVRRDTFSAKNVRFVRVTALKQERGTWPSLFELRLFGDTGKKLALVPRLDPKGNQQLKPVKVDLYLKEGNSTPRAHRLSVEAEAALLKDVAVPKGFTATLFAPAQMANYPTGVAAAPNGDLYVSSDGNGSIGRDPGRGRVLRLRDTDGDGRADEVTEFVRKIDSPRGLVWDHDRLYVLHPPHITVFFDRDGDGVADASKRLISNIAFGFKDRPADHTTNGLTMGIDGWIYIAVGDFGFMNATGTDGRSLQMRGGGVVRFRPDGAGLETFSDGTRNIYGLAVSPTLDLFTRDNTNDGGGWNVRFHHFTGLEDHGYPRLYKNFASETVAPLADYGGGSGCGAFYLSEPGIPSAWNDKPYTCDWGRQGSFRHTVVPHGATFKEPVAPVHFIKMTKPTDGDVDGMSAVYQASWKGPAQFRWGGVDHGYITRMVPTGFAPAPLPDFAALPDAALVQVIASSPSHVRRLNAQRMLLRRPESAETTTSLLAVAGNAQLDLGHRIAALYTISQRGLLGAKSAAVFTTLRTLVSRDDPLAPFVVRAAGDLGMDLRTAGKAGPVDTAWLRDQLRGKASRHILEAVIAAARQGRKDLGPDIATHLASSDPIVVHTAYRALARLRAFEAVTPFLDSDDADTRMAASWAVMRMHQPAVVDALLHHLASQENAAKRQTLIATLARLYYREGEWKGASWATRPDTRGPYYQLATWEESPRILKALNDLLETKDTPNGEAAFIVTQLGVNRIQNDAGLDRILRLAATDDALLASAVGQLAQAKDLPARAVPLVLRAAQSPNSSPGTLQECVALLLATDHVGAFPAIMRAIETLQNDKKASGVRDATRKLFLASPRLENHTAGFVEVFQAEPSTPQGGWSAQALLQLTHKKTVGPEARARARQVVDAAWDDTAKKRVLIDATFWTRVPYLNERLVVAMSDPNAGVAQLATRMVERLRIPKPGQDKTPKIAALKPADAIAQVTAYTGGDVALGEAVFTRATCVACHTVRESDAPKGPYLGSIADTYRRGELAEAIVSPNKTIAQGFATNVFALEGGGGHLGFVTDESGETVTIRDITSAAHTFKKKDITTRSTLPTSLMPPGLMNEFSVHDLGSLLDYLESLAKKK